MPMQLFNRLVKALFAVPFAGGLVALGITMILYFIAQIFLSSGYYKDVLPSLPPEPTRLVP